MAIRLAHGPRPPGGILREHSHRDPRGHARNRQLQNGLNLIAPPGLKIQIPNVLALLTGTATIIPIVVGKVVYVPLTVYLGAIAVETDPSTLWFPVLVALIALIILDMVPMMVIRPYLVGESTHRGSTMFSYIFGGLLFGWFDVFLGPLVLIATIHVPRVGLSELLHEATKLPPR